MLSKWFRPAKSGVGVNSLLWSHGAMEHGRRHAVRFKSTDDLMKAPKPSNAFDPRSEVQLFCAMKPFHVL